jgi:hypothetical protein
MAMTMADIIKLATAPTLSDEIKDSTIKLARTVLEDAEAGNVATLLVIAIRPDGSWSREWSGTENMSDAIGKIEIAKQEWIATYSARYK